jgi:hypothetical protein
MIGAAPGPAWSYILVLHASLLIPVTLLGLVFMAREGVRWTDVWEVDASESQT